MRPIMIVRRFSVLVRAAFRPSRPEREMVLGGFFLFVIDGWRMLTYFRIGSAMARKFTSGPEVTSRQSFRLLRPQLNPFPLPRSSGPDGQKTALSWTDIPGVTVISRCRCDRRPNSDFVKELANLSTKRTVAFRRRT